MGLIDVRILIFKLLLLSYFISDFNLGFHMRRLHLNVNNVHYDQALPQGVPVIFIYSRLGPSLAVQNFQFQYVEGFQKNEGYEKIVDYFLGGSSKKRTVFGRRLYVFYGFRIQNGDIFGEW